MGRRAPPATADPLENFRTISERFEVLGEDEKRIAGGCSSDNIR